MPFKYLRNSGKIEKDFELCDRLIFTDVLPKMHPHLRLERENQIQTQYLILPNGRPSLYPSQAGALRSHNPKDYFVLMALSEGLSFAEIELWLDTCSSSNVVHFDKKKRSISTGKASLLRFDRRKPIYYFNGVGRQFLWIVE